MLSHFFCGLLILCFLVGCGSKPEVLLTKEQVQTLVIDYINSNPEKKYLLIDSHGHLDSFVVNRFSIDSFSQTMEMLLERLESQDTDNLKNTIYSLAKEECTYFLEKKALPEITLSAYEKGFVYLADASFNDSFINPAFTCHLNFTETSKTFIYQNNSLILAEAIDIVIKDFEILHSDDDYFASIHYSFSYRSTTMGNFFSHYNSNIKKTLTESHTEKLSFIKRGNDWFIDN